MGSGHILIYAFEILMQIYLEEGYMEREAAESIIENNLYGLDIDKRAYQLAYFALMMKGRQYSRRILNKGIDNNLRVFEDSTDINEEHLDYMGISMSEKKKNKAIKDIEYLIKEFENAKEIGSVLKLKDLDIEFLRKFVEDTEVEGQISFGDTNIEKTKEKLNHILDISEMLNNKYEIMITNPPYLNKMSSKLKKSMLGGIIIRIIRKIYFRYLFIIMWKCVNKVDIQHICHHLYGCLYLVMKS